MSIEDRAQEHEAKMWEMTNAPRPTIPTFAPDHPLYGPEECDGCCAAMPDLRRKHGWRLCTSCQTDAELTAQRRR
jgi:hypothetical protein